MKFVKAKQKFTLAEMLVVLMLIGIIAGAISINLRKALHSQSFWSEVTRFTAHLQLAQDLMLIADADVHFKIEASQSEKNIKYWIETDKSFSKSFDAFIKKVQILKAVQHVSFPTSKEGVIDLKFISKGSTLSTGNMQLETQTGKKNHLIAYIPLTGHTGPIFYTDKKVEIDSQNSQDVLLTTGVIQELLTVQNEKKQPKTAD